MAGADSGNAMALQNQAADRVERACAWDSLSGQVAQGHQS